VSHYHHVICAESTFLEGAGDSVLPPHLAGEDHPVVQGRAAWLQQIGDGSTASVRARIARGLGVQPSSSCLQTLIFERKSALNFNPWAKFQTFRHLTPQIF